MTATNRLSDLALLHELEPVVASNIDRHLGVARDWMPHDYVPWDEGRNFAMLGGEDFEPGQSRLSPVARSAMVLNLLTEDNLPSYHRDIIETYRGDGAWKDWIHRWTAEEARHAIAMRDYLVVTRGVDPVALEQRRMQHVGSGCEPVADDVLSNLAYTTVQELATRISHRNTGAATGCEIADRMLKRIALDENLHMVFYRGLAAAAFDVAPDQMMRAVVDQLMSFAMPGADMPDFARSSTEIALAGIYDLQLHRDEIVLPLLRFWKVFERSDFSAEGDRARDELVAFLADLDQRTSRFEESRDRVLARRARTPDTSEGARS